MPWSKTGNIKGPAGESGKDGVSPSVAVGTVTTGAAGTNASVTNAGTPTAPILNFTIPRGANGSNATATPLATQMPTALGNAAVGVSDRAAREDHAHPLPSGRLTLVGTATISETMLVSIALSVQRRSVTMQGIATADNGKLFVTLNGTPTAGCELFNVSVTAANTLSVGLLLPALGVGATFSVPIAVWRVT